MDEKTLNLPGWRIIRVIGKGSFGCVYEIEKEDEFGGVAHSALKVISIPERDTDVEEYRQEGYDDKSLTALFRSQVEDITSEFRLMSKLKGCSNIVSFEDHWIVQHRDDPGYDIFIRMELLTTLMKAYEQELNERGYSDGYVQRVGADICRALELCGRFNIIHRDIKPQNIFVNELGDFKLGDFGIAKTSDHTTRATKTGTYNYMAPEVYWGKPYNASVDLYSLGLVLYWMMNERRGPFMPLPPELPKPAQSAEAMDRRMHGEPLPAPKNGSDALKRIVLKACAYDPKDRYASPAELRRDLERAVAAKKETEIPDWIKTPIMSDPVEAFDHTVGAYRKETEDDRTVSVVSEPVKASETERPAPVAVQTPVADEIKTPQPKQAYEATVGAFRAEKGKNVDTYEDGTVRIAAEPVFEAGPAALAGDADATVGLFAKRPETVKPPVKKAPEPKAKPVTEAEQPKPAPKPEKPAENLKTAGKGSKKTLLIIAAAAALAVITAVVLIVVLAGKGKPAQQAETDPTAAPAEAPTDSPTAVPTDAPTQKPTEKPTPTQTQNPTEKPTEKPTPTQEPATPSPTPAATSESIALICPRYAAVDADGKVTIEGRITPGASLLFVSDNYPFNVNGRVSDEGYFTYDLSFDVSLPDMTKIYVLADKDGKNIRAEVVILRGFEDKTAFLEYYNKDKKYIEINHNGKGIADILGNLTEYATGEYGFRITATVEDVFEQGGDAVVKMTISNTGETVYVHNFSEKWAPSENIGKKYNVYCNFAGAYEDTGCAEFYGWIAQLAEKSTTTSAPGTTVPTPTPTPAPVLYTVTATNGVRLAEDEYVKSKQVAAGTSVTAYTKMSVEKSASEIEAFANSKKISYLIETKSGSSRTVSVSCYKWVLTDSETSKYMLYFRYTFTVNEDTTVRITG